MRFFESKHRLVQILDTASFKVNTVLEFYKCSGVQRRERELSADVRHSYGALSRFQGRNHCFFYPLNDASQGEMVFIFNEKGVARFMRAVMGRRLAANQDPYHAFSPIISFGNMCASTMANAINVRRGDRLLVDAPDYARLGADEALQRGGLRKYIYACRFVIDTPGVEFALLIKVKRGLLRVFL